MAELDNSISRLQPTAQRRRKAHDLGFRRKKQQMSDYISEEVFIEILKRLSIQDAVRCTAVCKSWYSLITSPSFISLHYNHQIASASASTHNDLVLVRDYPSKKDKPSKNPKKELYSLHLDDDTFRKSQVLHFPISALGKETFFRVVGCVNGVVCLSDDLEGYNEVIILWNPSIRKYVTLPDPIFAYTTHHSFMYCIGFGFDAATNDFKVVSVVYFTNEEGIIAVPPKVEIYEPNVGSWREVDAKGFSHIIDEHSPRVFLKGNVHWVTGRKRDHSFFQEPNGTNLILSFNFTSEEFGVMSTPDSLNEHQFKQDYCVSVLGESLSLIHDTPSKNGNTSCIWVMKQYGVPDSWTKLFTIDVTGSFWWVFGFRRNGEALVKVSSTYRDRRNALGGPPYRTHPNLLVSFDPKNRDEKLLTEFGKWKSLYVDTFVESLALLGVTGVSLPKDKSADKISADEDSSGLDNGSRFLEPTNPSRPNSIPMGEVVVNWFD